MKILFTIALLLLTVGVSQAQVPGPVQPPANYLPNFYNRSSQPLSPYLNLFRGFNPGVDYYYGIRPGSQPGVSGQGLGRYTNSPTSPLAIQYTPLPSDAGMLSPSQGYVIPPAGHVNTYGNYFGLAGSSLPGYGARGGVNLGIGNVRPQPATTPAGRAGGNGGQRRP